LIFYYPHKLTTVQPLS